MPRDTHEELMLCMCGGDALVVNRVDWRIKGVDGDDMTDITYEIACWNMGHGWSGQYGWRERLRHIWCIIRRGTPWADFVDFTPEQAQELVDRLQKLINEAPK